LSTASKDAALSRMMAAYLRWRGSSAEPSSSSFMPTMPFMGVRISWLMLARNSLLARLAESAASRASTNCSS